MTEIMFEKYSIPAFFLCKNSVLSAYPVCFITQCRHISISADVAQSCLWDAAQSCLWEAAQSCLLDAAQSCLWDAAQSCLWDAAQSFL